MRVRCSQIVFNDRIDAALALLFVLVVVSILYYGVRSCLEAYRADRWTANETDLAPDTVTGAGAAAAAAAMR